MDLFETLGTIAGLLCVDLTIAESIWCWPVGIVNIALFFVMFWNAKLYAELPNYAVMFVLSLYGWREWRRGGPERTELRITRTPPAAAVALAIIAIVSAPAIGFTLHRHTDAALPFWDSTILVLSLLAQWMMAKKLLECWTLWIAVDVLGIGVYAAKGLRMTAGLYAVFLCLAATGLWQWAKAFRAVSSRADEGDAARLRA